MPESHDSDHLRPRPGSAVLGLDVGDARIGVAVGKIGSRLAFGRGAIERRGTRSDVGAVLEAAAAEGAETIVVGLPLRLDGNESPQTARVRAFADELTRVGVYVVLEDERLTTRIAQRQIGGGPLPRGRRQEKGRLDEAAAVLILESFLSRTMEGS